MSAEQEHAREARELRREVADLRAQRDALAEALRDIARGDYSDPFCRATPEQRARDALAALAKVTR